MLRIKRLRLSRCVPFGSPRVLAVLLAVESAVGQSNRTFSCHVAPVKGARHTSWRGADGRPWRRALIRVLSACCLRMVMGEVRCTEVRCAERMAA
jgi:hypothetical protein